LGPRPDNMSQNGPKTASFMMLLTKNPQIPTKNSFSSADQKTGRSVWALEQLSSTIGGGAVALVRQLTTAGFRPISEVRIYCTPALKVLIAYVNLKWKVCYTHGVESSCWTSTQNKKVQHLIFHQWFQLQRMNTHLFSELEKSIIDGML